MPGVDILGIGRSYADVLLVLPYMPRLDDVLYVEQIGYQGGGVIPTAMAAAARLGVAAAVWDRVSDDYYGDFIIADYRKYGVIVDWIQVVPGYHSALSHILVDRSTGTRSILPYRGTVPPPTAADFDAELVSLCRVLHTSGSYLDVELKAARQAKALGIPVSFDGGAGLATPERMALVELADVLVVARQFAQDVTGETELPACARALLGYGAELVVITAGGDGSFGWTSGGAACHQPAFAVEVVDTTGAGDVYHGAFLVGYLRGWPLRTIMAYASATAALKCTRVGGREGIPTHAEVEAFLAAR